MNFLFDPGCGLLAEISSRASASQLSDLELIARYPALTFAAAAIFGLGLVADFVLLARWLPRACASGDRTSWLKVLPPPWGMQALKMAGMALLGILAADVVIAATLVLLHLEDEVGDPLLLGGDMLLRVVFLVGLARYARVRGVDWRQALDGPAPPRLGGALWGIVGYLAVVPPLTLAMGLFSRLCQALGIPPTPQPVAEKLATSSSWSVIGLLIGFAVVIAPLFEEVLFRGFAYAALKQRWGPVRALVLVSAVFALIHLHLPSMGPLFVLGLALGLAYEVTGSLLAPIALHALFNATNVAMLLYVRWHP